MSGLGEKRDSFNSQMRQRRNNAVHMFFHKTVSGHEYWSAHYTIGHGTCDQYILCLILVKQEIWGSYEIWGVTHCGRLGNKGAGMGCVTGRPKYQKRTLGYCVGRARELKVL